MNAPTSFLRRLPLLGPGLALAPAHIHAPAHTLALALALAGALWALPIAGCATIHSGPPTVLIRVASNVPEATVWIDDRLVAPVSDFARGEKRLTVGFHRVEIRAPGYYSRYQEVDVKPNTPVTVEARLHELLQ